MQYLFTQNTKVTPINIGMTFELQAETDQDYF